MIGQTIGHYRIQARLGEGGMGVVYKADDMHLGRPVAIKVLPAAATSDPERKSRFVQEARTASSLNHPNIVHIYDIAEADGVDFIAMEYVPGQTLDQLIDPTGLPIAEVLKLAGQIAGALERAHASGIVHRDIKPANVMVTPEGLVKVLDFGLAKLTEPSRVVSDSDQTASAALTTGIGTILGTIAYMSPEQAEGRRVDARSDIFSFGSVLYEMISGQRPFQGPSKVAILSAILSRDPEPLTHLRKLPALTRLDAVVSRCLRKRPEDRFQRMADVIAALDGLAPRARSMGRKRFAIGATAAAAASLAVVAGLTPGLRGRVGDALGIGPRAEGLVVVLPFQCRGFDRDGQALCEGLAETVSRKLEASNQFQRGLRVLSGELRPEIRYDFQPVSGRVRSVGEAKKAGIPLVLAGTVRQKGADVITTATLVNTADSTPIRGVDIESSLDDVTELEKMIVEKMARILGLRWPAGAAEAVAKGGTTVPRAHYAYIQAHGYLLRSDRIDDIDAAIGLFQQSLERDSSYILAHSGLCASYWTKNRLTRDRQWSDRARDACLAAVSKNREVVEPHLLLGTVYVGTGQPKDAVPQFQQALELDPTSFAAIVGLANAYSALGQLDDAEETLRKLTEQWPHSDSYRKLGNFYVTHARYSDAEAPYLTAIELAPGHPSAYSNLGAVYHLLGRADDAIRMMTKTLAIEPSANTYSNLGTAYWFQGRYADAVPMFEKATEMSPEDYLFAGNLADAYLKVPQLKARAPQAWQRAVVLAEKEIAVNPNDAIVRSSLAIYLVYLGEQSRALDEISRARRLAPNDPNMLFSAARVYRELGRRDEAISALNLALENGYSMAEAGQDPDMTPILAGVTALQAKKKSAAAPGQPQ